ncbi:MAG: hypothetical protein U9Q05_09590 [Thermodesulfobacteriota bacterium]|nr:hypothetical protein [Thermodesulfobacteriota bacterium]
MTELDNEKLPTVEQVEQIMADWGKVTVDEFAQKFSLKREVVEATIAHIRQLRRASGIETIPVMACYRNDNLESIVRCAGSRHHYL